jgi:hypothetical protein
MSAWRNNSIAFALVSLLQVFPMRSVAEGLRADQMMLDLT